MDYRHRIITSWPRKATPYHQRRDSPFYSAKLKRIMPLSDTLEMLERELGHLKAKNIVIQTHHLGGERDLTREGQLRANARRPSAPGVILSFDSQHGPLSYPCDAMHDWESNLRAIAYHLEHVRLAGLYGVGADGEAYKGFAALPPAPQEEALWAAARVILAQFGAGDATPAAIQRFLNDPDRAKSIAEAVRLAHPDHGGSREALEAVMAAREVLKVK